MRRGSDNALLVVRNLSYGKGDVNLVVQVDPAVFLELGSILYPVRKP